MLQSMKVLLLATITAAMLGTNAGAETLVLGPQAADHHVDESALRYYASRGQMARVAAEARRLTRLNPAWHRPDDLYAAKPGRADEGPLWALFSDKRFDDLQAAIAFREAAEPGWHPSADLTDKLKQTVLRAAIIRLAAVGDWHAIVQHFKTSGIGWAQNDAEALWVIGKAYAQQNDCAEAYVVYRSLLTGHANPSERVATIEQAMAAMPMTYVEKLIAMGHTGEDGRNEFDGIAIDITRARISAFLHDEAANPVSPSERAAFEAYVRTTPDANQSGLVAWYAFKRGEYHEALDWFKVAISHGGDAMIAHGLAHTLRKLGMMREAEEVAYAWREPLVNNAILFIDLLEQDFTKDTPPFIEPARVARYAQVTLAIGSGEGAQALAWYAYNTCQYPMALEWFQRAVAWMPKEATVYGYALTLQRLKRAKDFNTIVNRYDGLFPKVVALAFDDGRTRPPPPCEANLAVPSAPPRAAETIAADVDWSGHTLEDTLHRGQPYPESPAQQAPSARYARARVPSPTLAGGPAALPARDLVKKTAFPVAVAVENPLRFSALKVVASEDRGGGPGASTPLTSTPLTLMPLVARRVPGVGPMPYERFGFTLLPGWDGTTTASVPTARERPAPVGTLASSPPPDADAAWRDRETRASGPSERSAPPLSGPSNNPPSTPGERS